MDISRQIQRAQDRAKQKDDAKLARYLNLSNFRYVADDKNMTYAAGVRV